MLDLRVKGRRRGVPSPPRRPNQNTGDLDAPGVGRDDLLALRSRLIARDSDLLGGNIGGGMIREEASDETHANVPPSTS